MIYKLKYNSKEEAIADLIAKGIYVEGEKGLIYSPNTHAVVDVGLITLTDPTFDENMNVLTQPVFAEGYHYDVMTDEEVVFENEIVVNNPKHTFAGHSTPTITELNF